MKPGQRLHIVNQLYPYTVQFKEDPTGNQCGTKRPRESASEDRKSQREAQSVKVPKQTENVSVLVSHGEATKTSVRKKQCVHTVKMLFLLFRCACLFLFYASPVELILVSYAKNMLTSNLL